jgi:uncharacterized DUF497 family protein
MVDLSLIVGFEWDEGNSLKSTTKHSVSQPEAEQIFADSKALVAEDVKHGQMEARYHAMGQTVVGRLLHVTFTLRSGKSRIRVISARAMNRKERAIYEQKA